MTTEPAVEQAVVQAVLEAVITEQTLPDDETLGQTANDQLAAAQVPWAGQVTASMVETIRLRLGIQRSAVAQQLQAPPSDSSTEAEQEARLGRTRAGGAFSSWPSYWSKPAGSRGPNCSRLRRDRGTVAVNSPIRRHLRRTTRVPPGRRAEHWLWAGHGACAPPDPRDLSASAACDSG